MTCGGGLQKMSDRFEEKETNSGHPQSHAFPLGLQFTVKSLDIEGLKTYIYLARAKTSIWFSHLKAPFLQFPENGFFQGGPRIHLWCYGVHIVWLKINGYLGL